MLLDRGFLQVAKSLKLSELGIGLNADDALCAVDDIADGSAREFSYRSGSEIHDIFVQRKGDKIFAFVNVCPHAGTPLNMEEGAFMERTGKYLVCHTHGALFQLDDGLCVAGPCNGARLQSVDIKVENGIIKVV